MASAASVRELKEGVWEKPVSKPPAAQRPPAAASNAPPSSPAEGDKK